MRIFVHDYGGHPFIAGLSRELARRGNRIAHAFSASIISPRGVLTRQADDPAGIEFVPVSLPSTIERERLLRRRRLERLYGRLAADALETFRPDVVISANTPPEAQRGLLRSARAASAGFVYWLQDVYGEGVRRVLSRRAPALATVVGGYYRRLEKSLLQESDAVVAITEDFVPLARSSGGSRPKLHVIPNWAPIREIPEMPKDNAWAREHGLADRFCFLYSGTLGFKHDPARLLDLAKSFGEHEEVVVLVASEGAGAEWLSARSREEAVGNLWVLPFQPFPRLPEMLAAADVLVAILEPDAAVYSVPSKVLTYLCAGRPLLLSVPRENLAARIVERSGAGLVANPGAAREFLAAARALRHDAARRARLGAFGRRFAEETFELGTITDRFEAVLQEASSRRRAAHSSRNSE